MITTGSLENETVKKQLVTRKYNNSPKGNHFRNGNQLTGEQGRMGLAR
jgi:hypothetical protein